MPLSNGDDAANKKLEDDLKKAQKFERKLRKTCEKVAKSDPKAFKALAKTYLSNKRCLLVALAEDNDKLGLGKRRSLDQLVE